MSERPVRDLRRPVASRREIDRHATTSRREVQVQLNARIPESLHDEIRRACFEERITYSELIRQAFEAWQRGR